LTLNTLDQNLTTQTNQTYRVYRPGMFLQYAKRTGTMAGGPNLTFADANPDTIVRSAGSWITDGFEAGGTVTVAGATNPGNNGTFIIASIGGGGNNTITLIAAETLTAEGPTASCTAVGNAGFKRALNNVNYPFNWRLFGNGGTLAQSFEFVQRQLRRTTDIDLSTGSARGDITDLLMSYASPTGRGLNLFIDDLASADKNNATLVDASGDSRNFAFIAGVTINLNTNLLGATDSAKVVVFFTSTPSGNFGTNLAIIVQDVLAADMSDTTPLANPMQFDFDYDNNAQGSRTPGTNAAITIVAISLTTGQYVQTTGTIQRQSSNIFSVVSPLERNYSNP